MLYYLIIILGDLDPTMHGPFDSEDERDDFARAHRAQDPEKRDGIFPLDIDPDTGPHVWAYSNGFFLEGPPAEPACPVCQATETVSFQPDDEDGVGHQCQECEHVWYTDSSE